jgi:Tfp pilus assembly protein PilF
MIAGLTSRSRSALALAMIGVALVAGPTGCFLDSKTKGEERRDLAFAIAQEGEAYMAAGNYVRARDKFLAAVEMSPRPAFLYNVAHCHYRLGNLDQAIPYYERALKESPDFQLARTELDLVRLQLREGEIREGIAASQQQSTTSASAPSMPRGSGPMDVAIASPESTPAVVIDDARADAPPDSDANAACDIRVRRRHRHPRRHRRLRQQPPPHTGANACADSDARFRARRRQQHRRRHQHPHRRPSRPRTPSPTATATPVPTATATPKPTATIPTPTPTSHTARPTPRADAAVTGPNIPRFEGKAPEVTAGGGNPIAGFGGAITALKGGKDEDSGRTGAAQKIPQADARAIIFPELGEGAAKLDLTNGASPRRRCRKTRPLGRGIAPLA